MATGLRFRNWTAAEIAEAEECLRLDRWKMDRMYNLSKLLRALHREIWVSCPLCDCVMLRQDLESGDPGCMHIQNLLMSDLN